MKGTMWKVSLLMLGVSLLVGCSGESKEDATGGDGVIKEVSELNANGETITIWMPPFGNVDETDEEFWQRQLESAAKKVNAKIEVETVPWDNYEEKFLTGISGGMGPDIGYMYTEMVRAYIDMGAIQDMDKYFSQEERERYIYWDYGTIDEQQYMLPMLIGAPRVLFCNMDLLGEAGYDAPPTTWGELEEMALAVNALGKTGFQQYWGGYYGDLCEVYMPYLWSNGGAVYDDEGAFIGSNAESIETAEWIYSLKEKGILTDSVTAVDAGEVADAFRSGDLAMYVSSSVSARRIDEAGINWDVAPALAAEEGGMGYTFVASDSLVMMSDTEYPDEVAYIMKAMTSAPVMEDFHQERYPMPPIGVDEAYHDNPKFETMYQEYQESFKAFPVVKNSSQVYNVLFSNLQRMLMDELTPEEALKETEKYVNSIQ